MAVLTTGVKPEQKHNLPNQLSGSRFPTTYAGTFVPGLGRLDGWGTVVPTDGDTGWAKAALFRHTDGSGGDDLIYQNNGTLTSCAFIEITSVGGADFGATGLLADVVDESTSATGVTVDSVLLKDGAVTASGDVAAGDNATLGYTATEGAVLTGQGSTNDVTIKNDAKATIMEVLTGTINLDLKGNLTMVAAKSITGAGSTTAPVIPIAAPQALSGAGAVTITEYYTKVTNTGSDALTLADGAQIGQLKKVQMIVDPGTDSTLTPANFADGSTITFADVGDYAILMWNGTNWRAIELGNTVDGVSEPAVA